MSRKLVLHVSKDFSVPEVYTSESVDDIQEALWIGATIQQSVRAFRSDSTVLKIKEDARQEVLAVKHILSEREKEFQKEIKNLEEEKRELQEKHLAGLKLARTETEGSVRRELNEKVLAMENRLSLIEERKRILEETRQEDISKARDSERKMMERVVSEKEKEISRLDAFVKTLQEAIGKQTEEIVKISGTLSKKVIGSANVKTKGSAFENEFKECLVRAYGTIRDFDLKNTAHGAGHEGDFVMTIEGEQIMWELKDYGSDVPKKEVDKFLRDMKDYKGAKVGIMVSKMSDIAGRHGACVFEIVDGRLLIFVNKYDDWDDGGIGGTGLFQVLLQIVRTWWKMTVKGGSGVGSEEGGDMDMYTIEEMIKLKQRLEENFATVQRHIEDLKRRRTEWRTHKSRLEETSRWVSSLLEESQSNLERLLKNLQSEGRVGAEDVNDIIELTECQKQVFQEGLDAKGLEWIQIILKYCNVTDDHDKFIELQELESLIAGEKKMSKDTIRGHIVRVVLEDCIRKKGQKKIITGLIKK